MKRPAVDTHTHPGSPPVKKPHPFFSGASTIDSVGTFIPSPPTLVHHLHLDPFAQPLTPVSSSSSSPANPKIAITFYDLDGTLIKPSSGNKYPSGRGDWTWWHANVLLRMKREWEEGRHLTVISNQGHTAPKTKMEWRAKLPLIASKLPQGMPLRILAGTAKDIYRKPNIGMFDVVQAVYSARGYEIDLENSLFVGDAAGRMPHQGKAKDHSDTDYKFALNAGLRFTTPEEHFLGSAKVAYPEPPLGFLPSRLGNLAKLPHIVPSHTPITRDELEIVLFVGPPASGKTTFFRRHFAPRYRHVNQDTLKTRDKCLQVAESLLKTGTPVVIDNTNRNRETRSCWVALAARLHVPIRLFHFLTPIDLARHNNMYRVCYAPPENPPRTALPGSAFINYTAQFEQPKLEEGFDEIKGVNFRFEGTPEQRKRWDLYMLDVK